MSGCGVICLVDCLRGDGLFWFVVVWCWFGGWVVYSGCEHLFWFVLVSILFVSVLKHFRHVLFFVCFLGVRWMPWYMLLMKDVVACDIPRGAG